MPGLDERIEQALHDGARMPDADAGLIARAIARKRARRQTRRNAATGAAAAAVLITAVVVTVVVIGRDEAKDVRVSTPPTTTQAQPADPVKTRSEIETALGEPTPSASPFQLDQVDYVNSVEAVVTVTRTDPASGIPSVYRGVRVEQVDGSWQIAPASQCRIDGTADCGTPDLRVSEGAVALDSSAYAGSAAAVEAIQQAKGGYARTPLVSVGDAAWVAEYERRGASYQFPPSHLVDITTGRRIDLQGEILSFAAGDDGTVWAVTHDKIVDTDGTEFRLKRIAADGKVQSNPLSPAFVPAGDVVVGTDATWVPVQDGVLRFGPDGTGPGVRGESMMQQDRRGVTILSDGSVVETDGTSLRRIDSGARVPGDVLIDTRAPSPLTDVVATEDAVWAVAGGELLRIDPRFTTLEYITLPRGFIPSSLATSGDRVVVTGLSDLAGPSTLDARSVAAESVSLVFSPSGAFESTIVVAGGSDVALLREPSGDLLLTSHGNLYRARLP